MRKFDPEMRQNLTEFGQYVAECMPKYVQKVGLAAFLSNIMMYIQVQLTAGDELEILIAPSGVVPVMTYLKNHHNCQFGSMVDICGVDIPSRSNRFVILNT